MATLNNSRVDPQQKICEHTCWNFVCWCECFCESLKAISPSKRLARQKVTEGKITALGTQMISIAQTSRKETETPDGHCNN